MKTDYLAATPLQCFPEQDKPHKIVRLLDILGKPCMSVPRQEEALSSYVWVIAHSVTHSITGFSST